MKDSHIRIITWYTSIVPYVFLVERLRYNNRSGNISFTSTIIIDDKYVKAENDYKKNNKKENDYVKKHKKDKKFKMGRPCF